MNNSFQEIGGLIAQSRNIFISAHQNPDGDSIGSVLGLGLALRSSDKSISLVMEDKVPEKYRFLPGCAQILFPHEGQGRPDLLILLDCTDLFRAGEHWVREFTPDVPVINIDHHVSNCRFGTLNFVDPEAASTAEIIYSLLKEMKMNISPSIATALYTGIVMDTGSFQYQNTTPKTLITAAGLLERGVDLSLIRERLFESTSLESLRVLSSALDHLQISDDGSISWTYLDQATLLKLKATPEHCEGVVNYPISLENVKVGLFFRETDHGMIKVGLRCRAGYDVNRIAGLFGGGGHKLAAGCTIDGPLEQAISRVIEAARMAMEEG